MLRHAASFTAGFPPSAKCFDPAVVITPATSMLSFTANLKAPGYTDGGSNLVMKTLSPRRRARWGPGVEQPQTTAAKTATMSGRAKGKGRVSDMGAGLHRSWE